MTGVNTTGFKTKKSGKGGNGTAAKWVSQAVLAQKLQSDVPPSRNASTDPLP
ncbi:hypothetical protein E4U32_007441, partial [Claviceps aff. humidiphila group G2b]